MLAPWNQEALELWYAKAVRSINVPVDELDIPTGYGVTHVLAAGHRAAPALFLLPGLGTCAPVYARALAAHATSHRVYSVDIPGLPGKSEFKRVEASDDSYARWLAELADGLGHSQARFLGTSLGAFIVLKAAEHSPERIIQAVLVSPAGICGASLWGVLRFVVGASRFKRKPSREGARALLRQLASPGAQLSESLIDLAELSFAHLAPDPATSRPYRPETLRRYRAPTLVLAGGVDPMYPPKGVLRGSERLLPHATFHLIESMGHVPGIDQERAITELVRPFFGASGRPLPSSKAATR